MASITLKRQIEEAKRELEMRKRVYPQWVVVGKLSKETAQYRIQVQEAIVKSLTDKEYTGSVPPVQQVKIEFEKGA